MFYKGIKKFFLMVGVLVLTSVVFVGCKERKTSVTSIAFKEVQAITLIIGEEYSPEVSITPSYASNLNYYFEASSNSNVIEISGTKIKAMSEGVAQLKVIAKDNEDLNDIIAVKVIPQAVKLDAPKNLTFDGNSFRFDFEQNANKYIVDINGVSFDIGAQNYITIEEITSKIPNVYNTILKAKVQAVGDGRLTESSKFSEELKVLKIGELENFKIEDNILKFSKLSGVQYYDVKVVKNGLQVENIILEASNYTDVVELDLKTLVSNVQGVCELVVSTSEKDYVTEEGVIHQMKLKNPNKTFITLKNSMICPNMKMTNLQKIYDCLLNETNEIIIDENSRIKAYNALQNMHKLGDD